MRLRLFSILCFLFSISYFPLHAQGPASVTEGEIVYTSVYSFDFDSMPQWGEVKKKKDRKKEEELLNAYKTDLDTTYFRLRFKDHLALMTFEFPEDAAEQFKSTFGPYTWKRISDSKKKTSYMLLENGNEKYVIEENQAKNDSIAAAVSNIFLYQDSTQQELNEEMMATDSFWVEGELVDMNWDSLEQTEEWNSEENGYDGLYGSDTIHPFTLTGVTDTISGYVCQQYEGGNFMYSMKIYTSTEFCVPSSVLRYSFMEGLGAEFDMSAIEGCPLKYEMNFNMMGMKMDYIITASEIHLHPVSAEEFIISDDYKPITEEELGEMMFDFESDDYNRPIIEEEAPKNNKKNK